MKNFVPRHSNCCSFCYKHCSGCESPVWLKKALPCVLQGPCAGDVLSEVSGSWQLVASQPGITLISAVLLCAGGFVTLCCVVLWFVCFIFFLQNWRCLFLWWEWRHVIFCFHP